MWFEPVFKMCLAMSRRGRPYCKAIAKLRKQVRKTKEILSANKEAGPGPGPPHITPPLFSSTRAVLSSPFCH